LFMEVMDGTKPVDLTRQAKEILSCFNVQEMNSWPVLGDEMGQ